MWKIMWKRITGLVMSLMILLSTMPSLSFAVDSFNDVNGHWAKEPLIKWVNKDILRGYNDNTVKPNHYISRAEFVTIINRIFGFTEVSKEQFVDVLSNKWYAEEIAKAKAAGYIAGYIEGNGNNLFKPDNLITRQEAIVILTRVFEMKTSDTAALNNIIDVELIQEYAKSAANMMLGKKYINGYSDGTLRPNQSITRAETISIINKIIEELYNKPGTFSSVVFEGNVVVNSEKVTLKDTVIKGDLYLAPGIKEGSTTLDNVEVQGTVFVSGGGSNSVYFRDSKLNTIQVNKKGKEKVRIVTSGNSIVENVIVKSGVKLEEEDLTGAGFKNVLVDATLPYGTTVEFVGDFELVDVQAEGTIILAENSKVSLKVNADKIMANNNELKNKKEYIISKDGKISEKDTGDTLQRAGGTSGSGGSSRPSEPTKPTKPSEEEWKLVWNDEFEGSEINMNNWSFDRPENGRYNGEIQSYTKNNAYVKDGSLIIEARKEDITEPDGKTYNYSSGKLITQGKQKWTYGKVEVKAKMPTGKGIWPAIWMMPEDEPFYGTWPKCGEIDIMELLGDTPNKVYGTMHFGEPHRESQGTYILPEGESFGEQYHVYSIEWEPGEIRWYLDGNLYHTENDWFSRNPNNADDYTYPAPFDQDFFLIMNISVGGGWPGNPDETTVFPQQMVVDYVRVYQKDEYPSREKPQKEDLKTREPLEDGNYVYNGSFDVEDPTVDGIEGVEFTDYWTFGQGPGGNAKVFVEDGIMNVKITDGGSEDYGVQLFQKPIYLEKGAKYEASFKAKAEHERPIKIKIGGDGDRGWKDYAAKEPITLTTEWETYKFEFTMKEDSDVKARYEFNMGLDDGDIWLDDVRLIKIADAPKEDSFEKVRPVLPSGNYIYNGTFDQGTNRMEFWKFVTDSSADAKAYITSAIDERRFEARIKSGGFNTKSIQLIQEGLNIEQGKSYQVRFDASAEEKRTIEVTVESAVYASVLSGKPVDMNITEAVYTVELEIDQDTKTYEFEFNMDEITDKNTQIKFNLGGSDKDVYLDNVFLRRIAATDGIEGNLIKNGIFDSLEYWNAEAYDPASAVLKNNDEGQFEADIGKVGAEGWQIQLYQDGLKIEKGATYEVSFKAKSTIDRTVLVQIQHNGSADNDWTGYFANTASLTHTLDTYTYTFTMDKYTDPIARFSFALGNDLSGNTPDVEHNVYIDNVIVRKIASEDPIEEDPIEEDPIEEDPIEEDPIEEDLQIINWTFEDGMNEDWIGDIATWYTEGNTPVATIEKIEGEVKVDIKNVGDDTWHIQMYEEKVPLEQESVYTISFDARATKARTIKVQLQENGGSYTDYKTEDVTLTETAQHFTFTFTMAKPSDLEAKFLFALGRVDGSELIGEHTIFIDNVSVVRQ